MGAPARRERSGGGGPHFERVANVGDKPEGFEDNQAVVVEEHRSRCDHWERATVLIRAIPGYRVYCTETKAGRGCEEGLSRCDHWEGATVLIRATRVPGTVRHLNLRNAANESRRSLRGLLPLYRRGTVAVAENLICAEEKASRKVRKH